MTSTALGPTLVIVCLVMALAGAAIYWGSRLGSVWVVPGAAIRAAAQLAAVATVLAAAMSRLWSSLLMLAVMFVVGIVKLFENSCGAVDVNGVGGER